MHPRHSSSTTGAASIATFLSSLQTCGHLVRRRCCAPHVRNKRNQHANISSAIHATTFDLSTATRTTLTSVRVSETSLMTKVFARRSGSVCNEDCHAPTTLLLIWFLRSLHRFLETNHAWTSLSGVRLETVPMLYVRLASGVGQWTSSRQIVDGGLSPTDSATMQLIRRVHSDIICAVPSGNAFLRVFGQLSRNVHST